MAPRRGRLADFFISLARATLRRTPADSRVFREAVITLRPGQQIAHYRVIEKIGEGGMGEVWKAEDTTLGRDVALKVLPEAFASDPERLARFEREARVLATLNHPHIAGIYGFHAAGPDAEGKAGPRFLAMELAAGEELADRLRAGALPRDETVEVARQIAAALEAAHAQGVVHRDLKPANVMLDREGQVKVLDFGLAKAMAGEDRTSSDGSGSASASMSPTLTAMGTAAGVLMGTAAYMSPEQARGKPVDRRTDVWAFGCVLYEMLTGKQAFGGETVSDTLAAILKEEPDWSALPADLSPALRRLLRRCLSRSARDRLHDMADARIVLQDVQAGADEDESARTAAASPAYRSGVGIGLTAALILVALVAGALGGRWWGGGRPRETPQPVVRFSVPAPPDHDAMWAPALAADGSFVVYEARQGNAVRLYLHEFETGETRPLPGTVGSQMPFICPDGRWIGFRSGGKLQKVATHGGDTLSIAETSSGNPGASWGDDGTILYSSGWLLGLQAVPADGGEPRALTTPDHEQGEKGHWWPHFLPGGRHALFTLWMAGAGLVDAHVALLDVQTGRYERLFKGAHAFFLPPGYIVYYRAGSYHAIRFDPATLKTTGEPLVVLDEACDPSPQGDNLLGLAVASDGTLVYSRRQTIGMTRLAWLEPGGEPELLPLPPRRLESLSLAPDGRSVVASSLEDGTYVIKMLDLEAGTDDRVNLEGSNWEAHWLPDGSGFAFLSMRKGDFDVYFKDVITGGPERPLLTTDTDEQPVGWSHDGTEILIRETQPNGDVWLKRHPLDPEGEPSVLTKSASVIAAAASGDGNWLAFSSRRTGRYEIYVQAYPGPAADVRASRQGGVAPAWSPDGRLLYYARGDDIIALDFRTEGPRFVPGNETVVATAPLGEMEEPLVVTAGPRFLVPVRTEEGQRPELEVVLNWHREVERLLAADR